MDDRRERRVEGLPRTPTNFKRPDLEEHLAELRAEFAGQSELAYQHAELVVRIRRRVGLERDLAAFFALWEAERAFLADALSSRWLVSALDTFVDHGTPMQSALALPAVGMIALLKLGETERVVLVDATLSEASVEALHRYRQTGFVYLWDGMTAYAMNGGNVFRNFVSRYLAKLQPEPVLHAIVAALIDRAREGDTLLSRLERYNPRLVTK